jgi:hypothetical protein
MGSSVSKQLLSQLNDQLQSVYNKVMTSNFNAITNYVSLGNKIQLRVKGSIHCGSAKFDQTNKATLNYKNSVTSSDINNLKTNLKAEIDNKTSQTMKIVRDFLGGSGSFNSQENITMIQTRLRQIVDNNVTVSHENKILNETVLLNENILTVDGDFYIDQACEWKQNNLIEMATEAMVMSLIQTCVEDSVISRIVNDSQQKFDLEEKGPASLIMAVVFLLLALVLLAKEGLKVVTDWKLWILVGIFVLIAFFVKIWPFKKKQEKYWGCAKDDNGSPTGGCKEYDNPKQGPFFTQALCDKASDKLCIPRVGCDKDGQGYYNRKCRTFGDVTLGPYTSFQQCEQMIEEDKGCVSMFGCATDSKGFNISPGTCIQYKENDPNKPDILFPNINDCETSKEKNCSKHFACDTSKKTCVEVGFSPYVTMDECKKASVCKK